MEKSKKGNMKIVIIAIICVVVLALAGGYIFMNKQNDTNLEKDLKGPVSDYFDKYMSVYSGTSAYKVTLQMLKDANDEGETYNLKPFAKCNYDKTYATVQVDFATGGIKNIEYKFDCKAW